MNENKLDKIDELIKNKKINEAQLEISKLGSEFHKNVEYQFEILSLETNLSLIFHQPPYGMYPHPQSLLFD